MVLGYPAEIVPLENPYAMARATPLRVRCLVDGRPVGNQTVLWGGEKAGQAFTQRSTRTDANGVAEVTVDAAGRWYVKFIHMVRATQAGLDYESKWAIDGQSMGLGALRSAWKRAAKRAGLPGRLDDLRRTAARNMRRSGLSEGEIMALCGWDTRSMFDRYNIIDEADLARAVAKHFNVTIADNPRVLRGSLSR